MRACPLLICSIMLFGPIAYGQASDQFLLQRVLQRYTDTYGGLRDANLLSSIKVEGVQIQDSTEYTFTMRKKRPSSIRYRLNKDFTVLESGFNGEVGWLRTEKDGEVEVKELTGNKLEVLKQEAAFEGPLFRHLEKPENKVSLAGSGFVGGLETHVVRVNRPEGGDSLYYLDKMNSRLLRTDRLNEEGETVMQTLYRDYREIGGHPFAFEVENRVSGETVALIRILEVELNPGLLSFYFEMPDG